MRKFNIIINYFSSFIIMFLLILLVIICILKYSVFNEKYLYKELQINQYYDRLLEDINEEINSYIISSGFSSEIINNLYTKEELINDVNLFINNYYNGRKTIFNKQDMYKKIESNIKKIEEHDNLEVIDSDNIQNFINDIVNIYQNEIRLYGFIDSFITSFNSIKNFINNCFILVIISLLILIPFIKRFVQNNYLNSCIMSTGIILIIIRIFLYERIDVGNILIITKSFSIILNKIIVNIGIVMYIISLELILVSIILMLNCVKEKNSKKYLLK